MTTISFDPVVEEAVHRLAAEFAGRTSPAVVRAHVQQGHGELSGEPVGAMPELVERLARIRILDALSPHRGQVPGPAGLLTGGLQVAGARSASRSRSSTDHWS
jgi:hypothetical protein